MALAVAVGASLASGVAVAGKPSGPTKTVRTSGSTTDASTTTNDSTTTKNRTTQTADNGTTSTTSTAGQTSGAEKPPMRVLGLRDVVAAIGADDMWAAGYTGAGIDVALIDTGVAPVAGLATTDVVVGPDLSFEAGIEELRGLDTFGHGTHMAGIIAGASPGADPLQPDGHDLLGVAPEARLVSVKIADNTGAVDVSQVIAAVDWVVQHRNDGGLDIRVLNLSYNTLGTQDYVLDPLSKAIENAWRHGIVVVVSAGNEGRSAKHLANPATNPYVIAVSAAGQYDDGTWAVPGWAPMDDVRPPDVVAPGVSVASLRNPGSRVDVEHPGGRVAGDDRLFLGSGTSQAAAAVSGAVALLLQQRPELTPDAVKALLTSSATSLGTPEKLQGSGLVDLASAMHRDTPTVVQDWVPATGLGSIEDSRGGAHVTLDGEPLVGEWTVTGDRWHARRWVELSEAAVAWTGEDVWSGSTWSGSTWSGSTWSGSTWSGSTWSGSTWSGSTWSGSTWSGSTWSGSTWSGSTWSGSTWSGSTWSGRSWS